MKCFERVLTAMMCAIVLTHAQDNPASGQPLASLDVPDDGVRVSVLGYHDFSQTERETAMRIRTEKFRQQMQVLKDLNIPVISMADFVAWKNGGKTIPPKAVVITIDDGWKSVYTDAYPILKEFGYPFTIYLYTDYVDGGGKALTTKMIREMMANGATIGSHSTTHPLPPQVKEARKAGPENFAEFLEKEMGASKQFLERAFGGKVLTYAYPGGYFTQEMIQKSEDVGYQQSFTVQPGKVNISMPNGNLPRYIVLGNYDRIFQFATTFSVPEGEAGAISASQQKELPYPVTPIPGTIINTRLPKITADFAKAEDIDPKSLEMRVAGFGKVPAEFSEETKIFSWKLNRRIRQSACRVKITYSNRSGEQQEPLEWVFQIDRGAAYLPDR